MTWVLVYLGIGAVWMLGALPPALRNPKLSKPGMVLGMVLWVVAWPAAVPISLVFWLRMQRKPVLRDLADVPGLQDWIGAKKTFNAAGKQVGEGDVTFTAHGVSSGRVYWDDQNKVSCREHRAMNCVNVEGTIWRCEALGCRAAAYLVKP